MASLMNTNYYSYQIVPSSYAIILNEQIIWENEKRLIEAL